MTKIAIFGSANDPEVCALEARLQNRGITPVVLDLSRFPKTMTIAMTRDDIRIDDDSLFDIKAAFLRNRGVRLPSFIRFDKKMTLTIPQCAEFENYITTERRCQQIRNTVIEAFSKKRPIVNPLRKNDLHRLKTYLFAYASKNGLPVPRFMVGTAARALRNFVSGERDMAHGVVDKPLAGIYKTHLCSEETWQSHRWQGRGAFYQRYIKGDTIRCYVLNGKLIAAAKILHAGSVDSSVSQTGIEVIELPQAAKQIAERAAEVLALSFCGMDLMHEFKTGSYYLIDCNMSPMFVNFARLSQNDIPAKIADYLIQRAQVGGGKMDRRLALLGEAKDILERDPDIRKLLIPKT